MYMIKIPQSISSLSGKSMRSTLMAAFQRELFLPGCFSCLGCSEISSCPFNDIITKTRIPNKLLGTNDLTLTDFALSQLEFDTTKDCSARQTLQRPRNPML